MLFSFPICPTARDPLLLETGYKLDVQYVLEKS